MWTPVRKEIEKLRHTLGLASAQFSPVGLGEWDGIQRKTEAALRQPALTTRRNELLWTQLRADLRPVVLACVDAGGQALAKLRPIWREETPVFCYAQESVSSEKKWWYRTNAAVAWQLLEHLWQQGGPLEEWGIVDRKYRWALFKTHADDVIFCGEPLVSQVQKLGQEVGVRIR